MGAVGSGFVACCCAARERELTVSLNKSRDAPVPETRSAPLAPPAAKQPARAQCSLGDSCSHSDPHHWTCESHPGDPDWLRDKSPPTLPAVSPEDCLRPRNGTYDWVRQANSPQDRQQRLAAAQLTLRACRAKGYTLGGDEHPVKLLRVDATTNGTRVLNSRQLGSELAALRGPVDKSQVPRLGIAPEPLALDAALARAAEGERVALLSPASAYHPGGGFRTGGRHALEESVCMQTSLYVSLQRALWLASHPRELLPSTPAAVDHSEHLRYIPEDGVVLSPAVEVFREGYATGYRFLPSPVELSAVISVAMPNRNESVRDAPMDAPRDQQEYRELLRTKLRAALGAARLAGATVAVVPGLGCGVYRNSPVDVGRALGEALCWAPACGGEGELREVVLAGAPEELFHAAMAEIGW